MAHCEWLGKRCGNKTPGGRNCIECMAAEIKYYRHRIRNLMDYGTDPATTDELKDPPNIVPPQKAERQGVYKSLLQRYGAQLQSVVALEELSECQKEICKFLRGKGNIEHLAEEVADATIMLEQIRHIYNLDTKVDRYIDEKVQRMVDRLEETT